MAFGNSDGDLQMLQWTTAGEGPRFGLIVHHDDAVREWAYDRDQPHRPARQGARRRGAGGLGGRVDEGRLADDLRADAAMSAPSAWGSSRRWSVVGGGVHA